jgi:Domain of unknown function (DUF4160)
MYPEPGAPHHHPHFHARYNDDEAVYRISPVIALAGRIPRAQEELVIRWAEKHQRKLLRNWKQLERGKKAFRIRPLV